jgi:hypothetical protein
VLVLDEAPAELIRLVGDLGAVSETLLIDPITITSSAVAGSTARVPPRVEPERRAEPPRPPRPPRPPEGRLVGGADDFLPTIERAPAAAQPPPRQLAEGALALEREGLVRLATYHGVGNRWTLLPRLQPDNVGLVTIWHDGGAYLQLWRSVFERRAPATLPAVEAPIAPTPVRQGNMIRDVDDATLEALMQAYREAAGHQTAGPADIP